MFLLNMVQEDNYPQEFFEFKLWVEFCSHWSSVLCWLWYLQIVLTCSTFMMTHLNNLIMSNQNNICLLELWHEHKHDCGEDIPLKNKLFSSVYKSVSSMINTLKYYASMKICRNIFWSSQVQCCVKMRKIKL